MNDARLKRELITREELESAARRQEIEGLDDVETCRLEIGGVLTFVPKLPTDDQTRHLELIERLDALAVAQAALVERVGMMEAGARRP